MSIEGNLDKELAKLYGKESVNWSEVMRLSAEIDKQREQAASVARRLMGKSTVTVTFPEPGAFGPPEMSEPFWYRKLG